MSWWGRWSDLASPGVDSAHRCWRAPSAFLLRRARGGLISVPHHRRARLPRSLRSSFPMGSAGESPRRLTRSEGAVAADGRGRSMAASTVGVWTFMIRSSMGCPSVESRLRERSTIGACPQALQDRGGWVHRADHCMQRKQDSATARGVDHGCSQAGSRVATQ